MAFLRRSTQRPLTLSATLLATIMLAAGPARAQSADDNDDAIIVTGKAQDVLPLEARSATRIDRDTIRQAGVNTIQDVAALVPNTLLSDQGSPRFSINTMRGIGNTIRNDYFNSTIGLFVDGVPLPSAEFSRRLVDVESIEVLRGPAGTAQGRFSLGGSIFVRTRAPTNEWRGAIEGTLGNRDQVGIGANISGPLVADRLYARAYVDYADRDGFIRDKSGKSFDGRETLSAGGSLRWRPAADLTVTVAGDYQRDDIGAYAFLPFKDFRTRDLAVTPPNDELRKSGGVAGTVEYDFGQIRLTSITAWRQYSVRARQDLAYTPLIPKMGGGRTHTDEDGWQISQELRLGSIATQGLRWTAGLYYQRDKVTYDYLFDVPAFGPASTYLSHYTQETIAGFGEVTVPLLPRLEVTGGLRLAFDTDALRSNAPFDDSTHATLVTPRVQVGWRPAAATLLYVSATRGARAGGFSRLATSPRQYDPEYLWQYEAGLRASLMDGKLGLNLAAFHIDWTDQQITQIVGVGQTATTNAGSSHSDGVEAELIWYPLAGLELSGNLGLTRARYDDYINAGGANLAGNRLVNTPSVTGGMSAQYRVPIGRAAIVLRGDWEHVGEHWFDPENRLRQGAYDLANARIGIERGRYSLSLFARNLFDAKYRAYGFTDSFGYDVGMVGQRRLIGITARVAFE